MVVAVVPREPDEPDSAKMCQALKSCSVCLDDVTDCGARSTAKLECGHHFHLDCIGSAFNAKGAMQCPNCRHVENGRWLFASGARRDDDFTRWVDEEFSIEEADDDDDEEPSIFPFLFGDANDGWDDFSIEDEDPMEEDDMEAELPFEEPEADDHDHDYEAEEDDHEVEDADPEYYAREYVDPEHAYTFEYQAEESVYEFDYGEADREYPDDKLEYLEDDREYEEADGWNEPDYQMEHEEDDQEYEEAGDQVFWQESDIHSESPEQQGGSSHRRGQSSSTPVDIEILLEDVMKGVDCVVKSFQVPWHGVGTISGSELVQRLRQNESEGASSSSPITPDPDKEARQSLAPKDSHLRPPGPIGPS